MQGGSGTWCTIPRTKDTELKNKIAKFNSTSSKQSQQSNQKDKIGSQPPKFSSKSYGRPPPGSKTEARGIKAHSHVYKEVLELCEVINEFGEVIDEEEDAKAILFGALFDIYARINNKLVGLLLRARKFEFVAFEGEVLFQRRDDDVPIILMRPISEIRQLCSGKIDSAIEHITETT